ncbi:MAG: hypothetical protein V1916_02910, partial [Patescibacteria group bacterium]
DVEAAETFTAECSYQHYRIAELDGQPVGLISWRTQGGLHYGVAELTRLAVVSGILDPRAIKESLFDVMIAEADHFYRQHGSKLRKVFSMIHADSKHIRDFFQDKGMHQEAVLRSHFHAGTDELVYSMFIA